MTNPKMQELVQKFALGQVSRRDFMKGAAAAGFAVSGLAGATGAMAAPGKKSVSLFRDQDDALTLILVDEMANGNWLTSDPQWFYEINPNSMMNVVYEPLFTIIDTAKPNDFTDLIAEGEPVVAEDGLSTTITLRQGVKSHKGNEITSKDVVFSWTRLKNLKYQAAFMVDELCTGFEAVDDYTVKITHDAPRAALKAILASMPLAISDSVACQAAGGTDAEDADKTDTGKDKIDGDSIGTGPFKVTAWDPNNEVTLEKNADYWGEPAKIDKIIFRNIIGANQQLETVMAGDADIAFSLDPDKAGTVAGTEGMQVISAPTLNIEYLALNNDEKIGGILSNVKVRQAIGHAIDYQGIIDQLLMGAGSQPATTVPTPLLGTDLVESIKYTTDLEKAQALWDESGVGEGEFTLSYTADGTGEGGVSLETLVTKLQADIQQIKGLTMKLNPMDGTERITQYRAGELQSTLSAWSPDYVDVATYTGPFGTSEGSAAKRVHYTNADSDALSAEGISELDLAKRGEIYGKIMTNMVNDAPFLVLYQTVAQFPAHAEVQGVTPHGTFIMQLRNASKA